jgi:hypothetical protein
MSSLALASRGGSCRPTTDVVNYITIAVVKGLAQRSPSRGLAVSGEKTKTAAVTKALKEFVARREPKRIVELFGTLEWTRGYDSKAERGRD